MLGLGTSFGPYHIIGTLGAGGMGEVYRATDTNLGRQVAIKVLPEAFAADPERLARFEREARTLAALNHPNIAQIFGLEKSDGIRALVMELVEGPTLADRIAQGPIPLDEALPIAKQITEALEAAHEQGIIHRDLKPANIKLRPDGRVKVLDFGLAKAREPGAAVRDASQSPTITTPALTRMGVLLGTAAYMSPEQARGDAADQRSDIWAFGTVLYEMLTGQRAFVGENVAETLASVLKLEPDWHALPDSTPVPIRRLLRRALQKHRAHRLSHIADARLELEERDEQPTSMSGRARWASRREMSAWLSVALLALALVLVLVDSESRSVTAPQPVRVELNTPPTSSPQSLAISPDGQFVVFVGNSGERSQLWIRSLSAERARALDGTDAAAYPFWSPDSRSVGFVADNTLKIIALDDGSVRTVSAAMPSGLSGGSWNRQGTILFPAATGSISSVSVNGGDVRTVIARETLDATGGYRAPWFLPDGRHFLFYIVGSGPNSVAVGDLQGEPPKRLLQADGAAVYARGHLLFVRDGQLFAQPFDADSLSLSGMAVPVSGAEIAGGIAGSNVPPLSAADNGTIVYRSVHQAGRRQFTWVSRSGTVLGTIGDIDVANALNPAFAGEGDRLAFNRTVNNNTDVWLLDVKRGSMSRFTTDTAVDQHSVWSPDGTIVVFTSVRGAGYNLYYRRADGTGSETLLTSSPPRAKNATDWSADGRLVLFRNSSFTTGFDVWAVPMEGEHTPFPVVQGMADERDAQFSPDGKWIAYESNQSGRPEIYVQPFPQGRTYGPLSSRGGTQVRWRADARELFYLAPDSRLMSVPIRLDSARNTLDVQSPVPLFVARVGTQASRQQYLVDREGERFLLNLLLDEEGGYPISMILNWNGVPSVDD